MHLIGWSLAEVLGLFGAVGAVTTALYFLRRVRDERRVPALFLWERVMPTARTARVLGRLSQIISWLIALLILALLAFALGEPKPSETPRDAESLLIVLDTSESMRATDESPTRLDRAKTLIKERLRQWRDDDEALLASVDARITVRTGWTSRFSVVTDALQTVSATSLGQDHDAVARFALDALSGKKHKKKIVFASDSNFSPSSELVLALASAHIGIEMLGVGRQRDNVGITALSARRYALDPARAEILVTAINTSAAPRTASLQLRSGERPIDIFELTLAPGESTSRFLTDISGIDDVVQAQLQTSEQDALPSDDIAFTTLPPQHRLRVLMVSEGNRYLEAALLLDEYLDIQEVTPSAYQSAAGYDVVIFDHALPSGAPGVASIYLGPPAATASQYTPVRTRPPVERPYFDVQRRQHPILRGIALADVNIARATPIVTEPDDVVLGGTGRENLLVAGERDHARFVALAFDVRESDLPLRIGWPLLVLNSLRWLVEAEVTEQDTARAGDVATLSVGGAMQASLVDEQQRSTPLFVRDQKVDFSVEIAGIYQLRTDLQTQTVAVGRGDPRESDIAPTATRTPDSAPAPKRSFLSRITPRLHWSTLAILASVILFAEWFAFHRRRTT